MEQWNILAASFMRKERYLLNLLRNYGEFRGSGYRDVVLGKVETAVHVLSLPPSCKENSPEFIIL